MDKLGYQINLEDIVAIYIDDPSSSHPESNGSRHGIKEGTLALISDDVRIGDKTLFYEPCLTFTDSFYRTLLVDCDSIFALELK